MGLSGGQLSFLRHCIASPTSCVHDPTAAGFSPFLQKTPEQKRDEGFHIPVLEVVCKGP